MSRGNSIVVSSNPKGLFLEGTINDTSIPGTIMEIVPGKAFTNGRPFWQASGRAAGKQRLYAILREDQMQGKTMTDAYVSGTRCFLYVPAPGEEVNVLVAVPGSGTGAGAGTTVGENLQAQPSGYLTVEAGTPEDTSFVAMEALNDTRAGLQLTWCMKT